MCMIRLHRHMGAGARIGPASDCWAPAAALPVVVAADPAAVVVGVEPLPAGGAAPPVLLEPPGVALPVVVGALEVGVEGRVGKSVTEITRQGVSAMWY